MSRLLTDIAAAWRPPPAVRHADWIPRNVYVPRQGQTPVRFDLDTYPHATDVLACFDDANVREIFLGWSAQGLGKTTIGIALAVSVAVNMPRPMLALRENQENTEKFLFGEQIIPTLEACLQTRSLLPPPHRRTKDFVNLTHCRIWRAYSGAPGTLSGYPAAVAICSEVSKWDKSHTGEADPVELVVARLINYPFDSKAVFESTPAEARTCRITKLCRQKGVLVLKRWVPCPHCGTYQLLVFGGREANQPGVKWDKPPNGRSDPQLAEETAWYRCVNGCRIEDGDRHALLRAGVWLADNQSIGKAKVRNGEIVKPGRITGRRPVASKIAFGDPVDAPFGALYSLAVSGWGFTARAFFDSSRQQFFNSILGAVYDPVPIVTTPHELAERLCCDDPAGEVPAWGKIVTAGIDCQDAGDVFPWVVCAWGDGGRGQEIEHGISVGETELCRDVLNAKWSHADGGPRLMLSQALIDSGFDAERIYDLARRHRRLLPCKGSSKPFDTEYRLKSLDPEQRRNRRARGRVQLVEVNTDWTQDWIQRLINGETSPEDPPFALSSQSAIDLDFLEELLNEQKVDGVDKHGYPTKVWVRRHAHQPNDFRDALRYAKAAASLLTQHGRRWHRLPDRRKANADPRKAEKRKTTERFSLLGGQDRPRLTPR